MLKVSSAHFLIWLRALLLSSEIAHAQFEVGSVDSLEESRVLSALHKKAPELDGVMRRFTEHFQNDTSFINNGDTLNAIEWVEGPYNEAQFKNYPYAIFIGESHSDHAVRWYTFLISENLKNFRYYDIVNDRMYPIGHWKKLWPATEFLNPRKK